MYIGDFIRETNTVAFCVNDFYQIPLPFNATKILFDHACKRGGISANCEILITLIVPLV